MKLLQAIGLVLLLAVACGCKGRIEAGVPSDTNLLKAREGFITKLVRKVSDGEAPDAPPAKLFQLVRYRAEPGEMSAYVSPRPEDGKRHPAIIWIVGGFSNSIGSVAWDAAPADNDQSASAFREAGILMMFPSFRGGNNNPGSMENFYGEVNDLLAAADYLAKLDYVDPKRIYLGGHSTGGTLAMLGGESTDRFRAIFALGPIDDVRNYSPDHLNFDLSNPKESELRSPVKWLGAIHTPTFVFEGTDKPSNITPLKTMAGVCRNPAVHFFPVKGATHFTEIAPVTRLIAKRILEDNGMDVNIAFTEDELAGLFGK